MEKDPFKNEENPIIDPSKIKNGKEWGKNHKKKKHGKEDIYDNQKGKKQINPEKHKKPFNIDDEEEIMDNTDDLNTIEENDEWKNLVNPIDGTIEIPKKKDTEEKDTKKEASEHNVGKEKIERILSQLNIITQKLEKDRKDVLNEHLNPDETPFTMGIIDNVGEQIKKTTEFLNDKLKNDFEVKDINKELIKKLLAISDSLEFAQQQKDAFAQKNKDTQFDSFARIHQDIHQQIMLVFKNLGIELDDIKPFYTKYDANKHNPVGEEVVDDIDEGTIIRVIRSGYLMNSKSLRPAEVIYSKKSLPKNDQEKETNDQTSDTLGNAAETIFQEELKKEGLIKIPKSLFENVEIEQRAQLYWEKIDPRWIEETEKMINDRIKKAMQDGFLDLPIFIGEELSPNGINEQCLRRLCAYHNWLMNSDYKFSNIYCNTASRNVRITIEKMNEDEKKTHREKIELIQANQEKPKENPFRIKNGILWSAKNALKNILEKVPKAGVFETNFNYLYALYTELELSQDGTKYTDIDYDQLTAWLSEINLLTSLVEKGTAGIMDEDLKGLADINPSDIDALETLKKEIKKILNSPEGEEAEQKILEEKISGIVVAPEVTPEAKAIKKKVKEEEENETKTKAVYGAINSIFSMGGLLSFDSYASLLVNAINYSVRNPSDKGDKVKWTYPTWWDDVFKKGKK